MRLYVVKVSNTRSYYNSISSANWVMKLFSKYSPELSIYNFENVDEAMKFITNYSAYYESFEYIYSEFKKNHIIWGGLYVKILDKFGIKVSNKTRRLLLDYDVSLEKLYPLKNQEKVPNSILRIFYLLKGKIKNDSK